MYKIAYDFKRRGLKGRDVRNIVERRNHYLWSAVKAKW